ncbi:MAG: type II toxin-antitoxin system HicB family antitoxin [Mariprofundaceae bacterium]|nr:type II toxin-antitoxin system HicB family antitoxin [Mariprofundaceae bacterium]
MRYPIVIEPGNDTRAYGVIVPDLPGCYSAGDTLDEAITNSSEAILAHIEHLIESGEAISEPKSIEQHQNNTDYRGWLWAISTVDLAQLKEPCRRINITIPERVLAMVDLAAKKAGESRSGYLAAAALERASH